ncbi:hypothetical protein [Actinoplanes couchii]|uniref:Lipoprotein n=1 Tax=Actinoplanes couchii TaxID=403638 RepID=A0ABQ3X8U7_9ACTN|nr:hypothetical protein [Actinoplanes couchii]MDR6325895.1 hypothetical protein [Actinoplanes couchii]GID54935.1 hypothetical protein Aco03nite_033390 [Actinoplanes couchii]
MRLPRSAAVGLVAAALCGSLTGCASFQELTSSSKPLLGKSSTTEPTAEPSPSVSVSASSSAAARVSGPLDTGSVVHKVKQGTFTVTLTYWTSDNAKLYTAASDKTLNIAAHIEDTDSTHRITATTVQVLQDDGTKRTDVRTDNGKFDVTPPYPYNTVVTLPAATAGASALTLTVRMDLLVETAPKAGTYYRSTALDTLTLPLVKDGATE